MTPYDRKPWLSSYEPGKPHAITPEFTDALSLFRAAVARAPSLPAILYFDGSLSYAELDTQSDALACAWQDRGITRGERVAIYLQNIPQFVIAWWRRGSWAPLPYPSTR
jgi:long-chain acyl-CoA synthetase